MSLAVKLDELWKSIGASQADSADLFERLRSEVDVAKRYAEHKNDDALKTLVSDALEEFASSIKSQPVDLEACVRQFETKLAPIGQALKAYKIHCCGHAHIDMNWMWPWQETVSTSRDTFTTVDRLMDSFPDFKFSQDQASTYIAMEQYSPETFEMIKRRVAEGRWDVTASTWVEGEKNLSSGEALTRQMLYTRKYMKEKLGLPYDSVQVDWEPDMFGHCRTLPAILSSGGVKYYYFCRAGKDARLFWWNAPDGSRVLAFQDHLWYNGVITPELTNLIFEFEAETGLKDYLFMYGVGDHGGGPTRRDLVKAQQIQQWPIYPTVLLSRVGDFFKAAEAANPKLTTIDDELNFVFEGCYTSESSVKRGNRKSECSIPIAEQIAVAAKAADNMPYPSDDIARAWQHTMFCQFHDILPGSGVRATYEYSSALYQEVAAITESVITRGLRRLASKVNTSAVAGPAVPSDGKGANLADAAGAGAGDPHLGGLVTSYAVGGAGEQVFLVYNPMAWPRSEVINVKIWNTNWPQDRIVVKSSSGVVAPAQFIGAGNYWGHDFKTVSFPANDVPAGGYKIFSFSSAVEPVQAAKTAVVKARHQAVNAPVQEHKFIVLENEYLTVEIETASASVVHLIDRASGIDFVPEGKKLGLIEYVHEAPNGMSAWCIGQILKVEELSDSWFTEVTQRGPNRVAATGRRKFKDSSLSCEISLAAGSRQVNFNLGVNWLERGTHDWGVPMLRTVFPVAVENATGSYETAFGSVTRSAEGQEVPALTWADLSGKGPNGTMGLTLVNESKYGHNADGNTLRLTLLRSSYAPDPLPEMGQHNMSYAVSVHMGEVDPAAAMRAGWSYNSPMIAASTDAHDGELPPEAGLFAVSPANVFASAIKKAEDSDAIVVRLFEVAGAETDAVVTLGEIFPEGASAVECDALEQPLASSTAKVDGRTLRVKLPAFGIKTVKIG